MSQTKPELTPRPSKVRERESNVNLNGNTNRSMTTLGMGSPPLHTLSYHPTCLSLSEFLLYSHIQAFLPDPLERLGQYSRRQLASVDSPFVSLTS
jgi:hypothetical protein